MSRAGGGRPTVEQVGRRIILAELAANGLFRSNPGAVLSCRYGHECFTIKPAIERDGQSGTLWFEHVVPTPDGETTPLHYPVGLVTTPLHFGGRRWWFVCPFLDQRCLTLYRPRSSHSFASRHYHRLNYASARQSARDRTLNRLFALRVALDPKADRLGLPARPKGMWTRTYERRLAQIDDLEQASGAFLLHKLQHLTGKTTEELFGPG